MDQTKKEAAQRFAQLEFEDAARTLLGAFPVTAQELASFARPDIDVDDAYAGGFGDYFPGYNLLVAFPSALTRCDMGSYAGAWLHHRVNPAIEETSQRVFRRETGLWYRLRILRTVVSHYSGLYCDEHGSRTAPTAEDLRREAEGFIAPPDGVVRTASEFKKAGAAIYAPALEAAEILYERFTPEDFRPIPRLTFDDARERIRLVTGIEI